MPGIAEVASHILVAVRGAQAPTCLLEYRFLPPAWRLRRWRARLACGYSFAGPSGRVVKVSASDPQEASKRDKLTLDLAFVVGSSSLEDHYWCSGWQTANLQLAAGLQSGEAVLEIGCGVGRLVQGLHGWFDGAFVGVDVHGLAIDYCRAHYPRFQFHHLDVYSQVYNPEGRQQAADMTLPLEDAQFDIAVLYSVYTHLLPSALLRLTTELARVLKPGGRCLASFLIYDGQTARSVFSPDHALTPYCRVQDQNVPEAVVGYQKAWIEAEFARMGFGVATYWPGTWTGNPGLTVQDQYLFVRN
jgi:SAM-dependent methyltransferase